MSDASPTNPNGGTEEFSSARVVRLVGRVFGPLLGAVAIFGQHMMLLGRAFTWLFRRPFRLRLYLEQMEFIGVGSMPIIMLVGFFSGAVTALQAITALAMFDQQRWVGYGVGVSLARELAPVFTALMITARAGSAMATELGSMRITEQIDALSTFAVNPVHYLVTPRLVASILMLPIMTMVFNVVGLLGAYIISILVYQIDFGQVLELFRHWVDPLDYVQGLIKAVIFGVAMALTACYQGFNVRGGAKEVGRATTAAVVSSSVSVLVLDYFLIEIMNVIWPSHGM
ncbi:MAG TPA: ABC transporter permease [Polyangia bacterium]|jgi:phospholipid/cholesterol/gamma-HCH transport system permease protein|nr:ABC transporter permease [Polyangia bacterium]